MLRIYTASILIFFFVSVNAAAKKSSSDDEADDSLKDKAEKRPRAFFSEHKRPRAFFSEANMPDKRPRAFFNADGDDSGLELDKRPRAFFNDYKRGGGRAFFAPAWSNWDYKRVGGRAFAPDDYYGTWDKRPRAFSGGYGVWDKRGGARSFAPTYGGYGDWSYAKRVGGRPFRAANGYYDISPMGNHGPAYRSGYWWRKKRPGGRFFAPSYDYSQWMKKTASDPAMSFW